MQAQAILGENLEFIMAGFLALFMFFFPKGAKGQSTDSVDLNLFDHMALFSLGLLPDSYKKHLHKLLSWNGQRNNKAMARLASFKLYPAIISLSLIVLVPPLVLPVIVIAVFFIADLSLLVQVRKRQSEIVSSLPQTIDLMLLCVDAGLSLDATLQRIANEASTLSNALNTELIHLSRDILLGMDRELAYQDLYTRTGVEELKSLAAALNQSGKLGLSVSKILRAQSQFIRMRQSQKAEERAARLPIWMAFPLWFTIMPSLFLILLGPSIILFFNQVGPLRP